ncbi:HK97 gp10 family phage protein [Paraburkholderia sacchari]|uniref:HK97 gp10 family phage protein n=1 Tax=Paraburkholderia sacchari TaxID=159450 RepID=UPI001BCFF7F0|nr:HK97 gp10 family phage protein [Paraburkholderia sacchari]
MKIDAKIAGSSQVVARIQRIPLNLRTALQSRVARLTVALQAHVVEDKLQGQVLNVRTGRLQRSINQAVVTDGSTITGVVSTPVEYAAIHEYGGVINRMSKPGVVRLREDAQGRLMRQGKEGRLANLAVFAKGKHKRAREVSYAPGGYVTDDFGNSIGVGKAYTITMPERSFLRSALADMKDEIVLGIRGAVAEGIQK